MSNVDMCELNRVWHSHKHEIKTRFQLYCFLLCICLLPKCVVSENCAQIYPGSEVYVKIGEPVELLCISSFSADHLEFRWSGLNLMNFTTKVNDTAIKLVIIPKPQKEKNSVTYHCKSNVCNDSSAKKVYVSLPPKKVKDFQCISENLETLTCSWISTDNIKTEYEVSYSDFRGTLQGQRDKNITNRRYCYWGKGTVLYRNDEKKFKILIKSSNPLGSFNETKYITDHFSIVKPAPVKNLFAVNVSSKHIEVQWEVHNNLVNTDFGEYEFKIVCDLIGKSNESRHIETVKFYSNNLSKTNKIVTFNLTGLPHMKHRVRVYMKPETASEKFWSEPSEIYVKTSSEIPRRPPGVATGSFHQIIFDKDRQVQIYWEPVKDTDECGPNFSYKISINGTKENFNTKGGFLRLNNVPKKDMNVLIWSQNEMGKSINASYLYIPFPSTPQVSSLTKHTYINGTYKLSWIGLHNVENYTIFWCPYIIKNNCTDRINYSVVGNHKNNFYITLPRNISYQFALSANYPGTTNGMTWTVCETYEGFAVPDFDVKFTSYRELAKTSVELHWSLNCILEEGYLNGYIIGYCPKGSPSTDCNSTDEFSTSKQHKLIHGLKPYTTYVFTIKLDTIRGIKSINETIEILTLPDTPTSPRNITISNVLNDSLVIYLDPPCPPNGDKGDIIYNIFNGNKKLKSSFQIPITVSNLYSYANYSLSLQACNVKIKSCSNKTDNIFLRTSIGQPSRLETPTYETIAPNKFLFKWKEPKLRGGNVVLYEIKIIKNSKDEVFSVTQGRDAIFKPCSKGVDNVGFKVRAVNNDSDAQHGALSDSDRVFLPKQDHDKYTMHHGEWSEERSIPCEKLANLTVLYFFTTALFTILLGYLVRKYYLMIKAKKDIYPIFAQGLFPSNVIAPTTVNENRSILNKIWLLLCKRSQIRVHQYNQQTSVDSNKSLISQDNILGVDLISNSIQNTQAMHALVACEDVEPGIKTNIQPPLDSNSKPDRISKSLTKIKHKDKIELHLNGSKTIKPKITNNDDSFLRNKFDVSKPIVNPKTGYVLSSFTNASINLKPVTNTKTDYVQSSFTNVSKSMKPVANTQADYVQSSFTNTSINSKPVTNTQTGYVQNSFTNVSKPLKPIANIQVDYIQSSKNDSKNLKPVTNSQTGYVQIGIVPEVNEPAIPIISTLYGNITT